MRIGLPWDKDKSPPPGASFFESDRPGRSTPSLVHALRKLSQDNSPGPSAPGAPTPLLALKLSTISFLDSVVHDGVSDNALYVIETEDNTTRIRRSDSKGFINVARVRWREEPNYFSRGKKDLSGIMLAFGKGQWKPADDFLGYSYSSIASSFLKFYLPHHPHSLRWKKVGNVWHCTTQTVKGPVAVLEPTTGLSGPELRIYHPVFDPHAPNTQRMHAAVPLSVLDFLLVTSMLLLTESDEWTNISRAPAPDIAPDPAPSNSDSVAGGLDYLQSAMPAVPPLPTPVRANTFHGSPARNRSTTSLASGPSAGSGIVERWRANVAPRPPTPDDAARSGSPGTSQSQSKRASRSSAESERPRPPSPLTHRFSMRSIASGSGRPHTSHGVSPSVRDLPVPPVPQIPPLAYEPGGPLGPPARVTTTQQMLARSPSPATSQQSGSLHATPPPQGQTTIQQQLSSSPALGAWEPQASPVSPAFAERTISSRSYPPSSSGSSTPYPSTPSRALPQPPLPLPPVPASQPIDRQMSKSPGFAGSVRRQPSTPLPSSPSPSNLSGMSASRGQDIDLRRTTLFKAPPGYATAHTDEPVPVSVPATPDLPAAVEGLSIASSDPAPTASPRPETLYDTPPPAYSQQDLERRQAALNTFGPGL